MLLRIVIGYHFFKEGTNKLKSGSFTSEYFLLAAKGPLAEHFQGLLDDPDGRKLLCVTDSPPDAKVTTPVIIDTELTTAIWQGFLQSATNYHGFGSQDLIDDLKSRRSELATEILELKSSPESSIEDIRSLEAQRIQAESDIKAIRQQPRRVEEIYRDHKRELIDWTQANKVDLIAYFSTADRLTGFDRDGNNRQETALNVDSLRGQLDTIKRDRDKQLNQWKGEVTQIWDSFEQQINSLVVDKQTDRPTYALHRHFDKELVSSYQKWIDQIIPWFDTIVGALLILGLFTRSASLAAAGFLASVVLTQPAWIPGTAATYYESIELVALLVIFATCAGRMGGLDYFFSFPSKPATEDQ